MTITSFAITVDGQCCRRHVVSQVIVSDINVFVVVEVFVACVLNLIILICFYACSLLYLERLFCFTSQTHPDLQRGSVCLVSIRRVSKNCAKLFLSELRQISTNFDNFWQKDDKKTKIMRGVLIFHLN